MNLKVSLLSRLLLVISSGLLVCSLFVPIWQIDLSAPQYPEGLNLKIWADKLGGDVDIINGLNHYIGMKTLHAENFIEFTILKYIILFYAAASLLAAIIGRKKVLYSLFTLFVVFGIIAMIDFYRWEYNYGHDLDPHAAIILPGMAYQPPLIGFKQLLNFGAYSIPDTGGWLFILSGLLMLTAVLVETKFLARFKKRTITAAAILLIAPIFLPSCKPTEADPVIFNKDGCDYCKMTIADNRFACAFLTSKGRTYKFDDLSCMLAYADENIDKSSGANFFANEYLAPNKMMALKGLVFIECADLGSPMGSNTAAFSNKDSADHYMNKWSGKSVNVITP